MKKVCEKGCRTNLNSLSKYTVEAGMSVLITVSYRASSDKAQRKSYSCSAVRRRWRQRGRGFARDPGTPHFPAMRRRKVQKQLRRQ